MNADERRLNNGKIIRVDRRSSAAEIVFGYSIIVGWENRK
jgi:hypothetical protein